MRQINWNNAKKTITILKGNYRKRNNIKDYKPNVIKNIDNLLQIQHYHSNRIKYKCRKKTAHNLTLNLILLKIVPSLETILWDKKLKNKYI